MAGHTAHLQVGSGYGTDGDRQGEGKVPELGDGRRCHRRLLGVEATEPGGVGQESTLGGQCVSYCILVLKYGAWPICDTATYLFL